MGARLADSAAAMAVGVAAAVTPPVQRAAAPAGLAALTGLAVVSQAATAELAWPSQNCCGKPARTSGVAAVKGVPAVRAPTTRGARRSERHPVLGGDHQGRHFFKP